LAIFTCDGETIIFDCELSAKLIAPESVQFGFETGSNERCIIPEGSIPTSGVSEDGEYYVKMEATYARGRGNADKCQIKADVEETVVVATAPSIGRIRFRVLPCRRSAERMSFLARPFDEALPFDPCLCKNRGECVRD
ncbi:unnamed protein product, partial [Owenia fusiformis]